MKPDSETSEWPRAARFHRRGTIHDIEFDAPTIAGFDGNDGTSHIARVEPFRARNAPPGWNARAGRRGHAASLQPRRPVRHRDGPARHADLRLAPALRRELRAPTLPRGKLGRLRGRAHGHRDACRRRDLPRWRADHLRGRRLLHRDGKGISPVQTYVRARRFGRHARRAHGDHQPRGAASGDPARDVVAASVDHPETRLRRRAGHRLAPAQHRERGGVGPVPADGVQPRPELHHGALRRLLHGRGPALSRSHRDPDHRRPVGPRHRDGERRGATRLLRAEPAGHHANGGERQPRGDVRRLCRDRADRLARLQHQARAARRQAGASGDRLRGGPGLHHQCASARHGHAVAQRHSPGQPVLQPGRESLRARRGSGERPPRRGRASYGGGIALRAHHRLRIGDDQGARGIPASRT